MYRYLVTGGAGFIGSNFVKTITRSKSADAIVVLDLLTYAGCKDNLKQEIQAESIYFVHGDICDTGLVRKLVDAHKINTIVHFAAASHVDRSIAEPDEFIRTNILGTHSLLRVARECWLNSSVLSPDHRFHHVSTDEVFGSLSPDDPPFTETTRYSPNSPYSASKAGSDHLVRAYHETYGLNVTISNCSNNYGPYQFPEKLIPLTIVNVLLGRPIGVYGDGSNIRDWLHVEDHCRGIQLVIEHGVAGHTYNVGGNCERSNLQIVSQICADIDRAFAEDKALAARYPGCPAARGQQSSSLISFVRDRAGHDWRYAIDGRKIAEDLRFAPEIEFGDGLGQLIKWMITNEAWWRSKLPS